MDLKPIERRRACSVCLKDDELLMVNLYDSQIEKHFWMPPGGEIQDGEGAEQAAERECREETGVLVSVLPETKVAKEYRFEFNGLLYLTKTDFFWAVYEGEDKEFDPSLREDIIFAREWVPMKVAFERMAPWEAIQTAVYDLAFPVTRDGASGVIEFEDLE